MNSQKMLEILNSIVESCLGSSVPPDKPLAEQNKQIGWWQKLTAALCQELGVELTIQELQSAASLIDLSDLVALRLPRDINGQSIVDIYARIEQFAREELSHGITYHWFATWKGDLLRDTDSLDDVEIVIRMEDAFGFSIPDRDVAAMQTVAQTVRYLWRRSAEQDFTLRRRPAGSCRKAFVFHELRRLLIRRTGLPQTDIHPNARLGDLMPTWHFQFWLQIQRQFGIDLPHGNALSRSLGIEKRTTIKELVGLIIRATS